MFSDCFQRSHTNIRALVQLFKADLLSGGVCLRDSGGQAGRSCSHAQHAAAVGDQRAVLTQCRAGVVDCDVALPFQLAVGQAGNGLSLFIGHRVAAGSQNNAAGGTLGEFDLGIGQCALGAGSHDLQQVTLQQRQHHLGLGIAEAAVAQVARALIEEYRPEDGVELLFDPYMGSGTSLVEASIKGINAIGTDLNPLARLMSHVKTTHYDLSCIRDTFSMMQALFFEYSEDKVKNKNFDNISNYTYWYSRDSLLRLSYIYQVINECVALDFADFFKVPLSETVREVSFTRNGEFKRFRMKEEKIKDFKPDVFRLFEEKVIRNINGLEEFNSIKYPCNIGIYDFNSTIEIPSDIIQPNSVDMVVTSPPYGDSRTTVAYGQFSRWANEWFNFENAKTLDNLLMGGRVQKEELFETKSIKSELDEIKSIDPKRNLEVVSFLNDYSCSIKNVASVIKSGGVVCYVVGNRTVKGVQIPLDYFTAEMFEKNGFTHIDTIVREIPNKRMPSKTSPTNVAGKKVSTMCNEYIVILEKK